ncbi:Transcriptional activator of glycolytic enzymes domain containing protein [Elaphomyces granulatus]
MYAALDRLPSSIGTSASPPKLQAIETQLTTRTVRRTELAMVQPNSRGSTRGRTAFVVRAVDLVQASEQTGQASDLGGAQAPPPTPVYSLFGVIGTVPQLWDEWMVGIEGKPAVQDLERSYGPAWRPSASERVLFSRRKVIINEIRARIKWLSLDAAVKEVEESRGKHCIDCPSRLPTRVGAVRYRGVPFPLLFF